MFNKLLQLVDNNNTQFLRESYELATKQPFGRLLIDLSPKKSDALRYFSNILHPGPSTFYLPQATAVIIYLTDGRERNIYASANATSIGYQVIKVNQVSY